jgi:membrane protease YdiL (CAAX protease family)
MLARAVAVLRDHPLLTPLLVVYASITVLGGLFMVGPLPAIANLILLAAYIALIHFATSGRDLTMPAAQAPSGRPRDIGLAVTVAIVQMAGVLVFWLVLIPHGVLASWAADIKAAGIPPVVATTAANAALGVPLLLLPTLVAMAAFRVGPREVGLTATLPDLTLGVVLAAIGVGLGWGAVAAGNHPGLLWESAPIPTVAAAITLQSLVNGIPEELAFRGVIFGRLLPWLGRPGNSLALSTMVFGLYHVPLLVVGSRLPIWEAVPVALFGTLPGLVLGYLFYRTRSIWPGAIWHTSITGVGLMFA